MFHNDSEKWLKLRKLGRGQFVLRFGVLGWGLPTAVLFSLIRAYENGWDTFLLQLLPALVLFPLGGIVWGRIMWWLMERKHGQAAPGALK